MLWIFCYRLWAAWLATYVWWHCAGNQNFRDYLCMLPVSYGFWWLAI